jgi:hypothetical protein
MNMLLLLAVASTMLAAAMGVVTWRVVREDRRRSDARVAALAADVYTEPSADPQVDLRLNEAPHVRVDHLFTPADDDRPQRAPFVSILAGGALVVVTVGALLVWLTSAPRPATASAGRAAGVAAAPAQAPSAPLELLALAHEREDDRLTVRGIVRNPPNAGEVANLTAVVLLFNQQGGFLTSGRAAVHTGGLRPGMEAPFVVTVPGAAEVGRYRVSFRTESGVVPHVDRRSEEKP